MQVLHAACKRGWIALHHHTATVRCLVFFSPNWIVPHCAGRSGDLTLSRVQALDPRAKGVLQEVIHEDKKMDDKKVTYFEVFIATLEARDEYDATMDMIHEMARLSIRA